MVSASAELIWSGENVRRTDGVVRVSGNGEGVSNTDGVSGKE